MTQSSAETQNAVIRAIPEDHDTNPDSRPDRYKTKEGVVFRLKPVPPFLMMDAQRAFPAPKPPSVPNYDKDPDGKVLEENPADPEYQRLIREYNEMMGDLANGIMLTRGTEVLSVPDGMDKVDDGAWAEDAREFGRVEVPAVGRRRYFCWLKYVALTNMGDYEGLLKKISAMSGMTMEVDVARATADFPNQSEGDTPVGVPTPEEDGRGPGNLTVLPGGGA